MSEERRQFKHACPKCGWEGGMHFTTEAEDDVEFGCGHRLVGDEAKAWMESDD